MSASSPALPPASARQRILVVDDEPHIRELLALYLGREGYDVIEAGTGEEALRHAATAEPALVVLDVMLPGVDGLQVCQQIRRVSEVPVVLLTARTSDIDKIAGLRLGADDYITKPFNPEELMARVGAVLRRTRAMGRQDRELVAGPLAVDVAARVVTVAGRALALTPREFDLLAAFVRMKEITLDREQLLDLAWGTSFYAARTIDVHVARLRDKLRGSGWTIHTAWGRGYRFGEVREP